MRKAEPLIPDAGLLDLCRHFHHTRNAVDEWNGPSDVPPELIEEAYAAKLKLKRQPAHSIAGLREKARAALRLAGDEWDESMAVAVCRDVLALPDG